MIQLLDPTFRIQSEPPTPASVGLVLGANGDLWDVSFHGQTFACRAAGPISAGDEVSIAWLDPYPFIIASTAGYPTRYPKRLSDFHGRFPASATLLYWMRNNPKTYTYRPGYVLQIISTTSLLVQCWDGVSRILDVEYAGVSQATSLSVGDECLCYRKDADTWVVVDTSNATYTASFAIEENAVIDDDYDFWGIYRGYYTLTGTVSLAISNAFIVTIESVSASIHVWGKGPDYAGGDIDYDYTDPSTLNPLGEPTEASFPNALAWKTTRADCQYFSSQTIYAEIQRKITAVSNGTLPAGKRLVMKISDYIFNSFDPLEESFDIVLQKNIPARPISALDVVYASTSMPVTIQNWSDTISLSDPEELYFKALDVEVEDA